MKKESNLKYSRTVKGLITDIYATQRSNCKRRELPMPTYTKQEFQEWILSQINFEKLYNNWVKSNYEKFSRPSVDRLNDYRYYELSNIRLVTWRKNHIRGNKDRLSGKNNKMSREINQYDLFGNFIKNFYSIRQASRNLNITYSNIAECCQGKRKSCKKYNFNYA